MYVYKRINDFSDKILPFKKRVSLKHPILTSSKPNAVKHQ